MDQEERRGPGWAEARVVNALTIEQRRALSIIS
jgi:hypothetical protein